MVKVTYSEEYLQHHGIKGQKWGDRNGPPYPLGASDHSAAEKKAGGLTGDQKKDKKILKEAAKSAKYTDAAAKYSKAEYLESYKKMMKQGGKERDNLKGSTPENISEKASKKLNDMVDKSALDGTTASRASKVAKEEAERYHKLAQDYAKRYGDSKISNINIDSGSTKKATRYVLQNGGTSTKALSIGFGIIGATIGVRKNKKNYEAYKESINRDNYEMYRNRGNK